MASTCFRWACRVSARKCGMTVYFSGFGVTRCRPVQHILCCHYTSQPEPKKSVESWWKQKYNVLETSYMNALKRFPFLYKVTTVFGKGTKLYYRDVKEGLRVRKLMKNGKPFQALTWKEMYSIRKMIHDARRVLPTLIIIALPIPLWFYVCLPMLYFFPRYLLTPHFYLPEQRIPFGHLNHYSRVTHYKNILDYLQLKTPSDQIHEKTYLRVLMFVCWDRGLDSTEATKEELIIWLKDWIKLSSTVSGMKKKIIIFLSRDNVCVKTLIIEPQYNFSDRHLKKSYCLNNNFITLPNHQQVQYYK
ncbi:LETM1 domain-containing protein 1-like [Saccoglossus kowalevskii]